MTNTHKQISETAEIALGEGVGRNWFSRQWTVRLRSLTITTSTSRLESAATSAKSLAAISGIIVAAGEVFGGILFGFMGHLTVKRGRHPIILLGFVLTIIAYVLMFINIPAGATIEETMDDAYVGKPLVWLALVTSFLLGFGDACFMTQVLLSIFMFADQLPR